MATVVQQPDHDYERYRRMHAETQSLRGVSLWQDGWKRLRRNRAAYFSLRFLVVAGLLSFLTPLLPLQSPQTIDLRGKKFAAPNFNAVRLEVENYEGKREPLTKALAKYNATLTNLEDLSYQEILALRGGTQPFRGSHPFEKVWNKLGATARFLTRTRMLLFGDYCLPSLCGNDELGRDVLARIFWGSRVSFLVALTAACVAVVIGVSYGSISGYFGGTIDAVMMKAIDILYCVPFLFIAIFLISIMNNEQVRKNIRDTIGWEPPQIAVFYFVIGAFSWLTMARVVRGQVLSLKNEQFVDAARTIGASSLGIVFRHLVPNVLGIVIAYLTLTIPSIMLFEAVLSFLGLGVRPPDVSWGLLMNEGVKVITPIKTHWWLTLFPGMALSFTLFAFNFLGDGLRDALDPRMKNR